jgi:Holliday junction DNA helicase RuvA
VIGRLTGRIAEVFEGGCILDVNGVGYLLGCSARTLDALREAPVATMLVETQVRQDSITLTGFADATERAAWRKLTTIQQVGPRLALDILSALAPEALAAAVRGGDRAALRRVPGVGPKLAERLVTELRGWAGEIGAPAGVAVAAAPGVETPEAEALSALANLGLRGPAAAASVARAAARLPGAAVEVLIREALKEMAPR